MRNSTSCNTSKSNTAQDESNSYNAEKSSAKKLRQARLPFKVIDPGTSLVDSKPLSSTTAADKDKDGVRDTHTLDGRKRKLSCDTDDDGLNDDLKKDDNTSKENVEILAAAAAKKKKLSVTSSNDAMSEVLSHLDEDSDNDDVESKDAANSSVLSISSKRELKTPKTASKNKERGAGTPKTASAQKDKSCSATKLQIKLPLSSNKKKRRKSSVNQETSKNTTNEILTQQLSSDEIEEVAAEFNPYKRAKINVADAAATTPTETKCVVVADKKKVSVLWIL